MTQKPGARSRCAAEPAAQAVVLSAGFFGLVAQALVFRDFLTVFEGNELGIAWFFTSWLVWVAVGALGARVAGKQLEAASSRFEFLPLLYVPAFLLQTGLIAVARAMAGVEAFELFPLARMLPVSFLANAPVSLCTGLLFPLGCRWLAGELEMPVARVYVLESLGSALGGITVTVLLALGTEPETLFLGAALVVSLATCIFRILGRSARWSLIPLATLLVLLATGMGKRWNTARARAAWERIMPPGDFIGTFTTPRARYLYGYGKGQFNVVAWQTVAETLPDLEHASQTIATHLAQCPTARKFLVLGPGSLALCRRLLDLPQAELITWLDTDPDYPHKLLAVLPAELRKGSERLDIPALDVRRHLDKTRRKYDVILVNLPDVTTLSLNRYFTREFFTILAERLSAQGVVGVRTAGADNFMGTALANTGTAIHHTLDSVFANVVIRPGAETWLIASNSNGLSISPAQLRDRLLEIPGASDIYPPEAVMSLYVPDRIAYQRDAYAKALAEYGDQMMLNTDRRPKALLYSLLFATRQAGTAVSLERMVTDFARSGVMVIPLAVLVYVLARLLFKLDRRKKRAGAATGVFDHMAMVTAAGILGMGINLCLMFMYQAAFGSIFLHIGLISALFMLGLSLGGMAAETLLSRRPALWRPLLLACCCCHLLFMLLACFALPGSSRSMFCISFLGGGVLSGVYVPVAAARFRESGIAHLRSGSVIEMSDHLGGALGGVVVGLLLIPAFGAATTFFTVSALLAINLLPVVRLPGGKSSPATAHWFLGLSRPAGYAMAGIAVFTLASSLILGRDRGQSIDSVFREAIQSMAAADLQMSDRASADLRCREILSPGDDGARYFVCSDRSAPNTCGYGGGLVLAAMLDGEGRILAVRLLPSDETPAYVQSLQPWLERLRGEKIHELHQVDAVSGATLTSAAVLSALRRTGRAFAANVLRLPGLQAAPRPDATGEPWVFLPAVALAAALFMRRVPRKSSRRLFLLAVVALLGVFLNFQYSLAHVFALLLFRLPSPGFNSAFLLVPGVPLVVLLFGNVYCGHLCPFGAMQELVGDLRPAQLATDPPRHTWRYARAVKYALLFVLVMAFAATLRREVASSDPLVTAFSRTASGPVAFTFVLLGLSFVFRRFWCRNLCPTGAFLAVIGRIRLARRLVPRVAVKLCDLGVESNDEFDCICCDRCRRPGVTLPPYPQGKRHALVAFFFACVLVATILILRSAHEANSAPPVSTSRSTALSSGGKARDVDMRRLRGLLDQGRLSGHEARYYRRVGEIKPGDGGSNEGATTD